VLLLSFGLSWLILLPSDFAYEWLYSLIEIDKHIATYAPKNLIKLDFESTTDLERFRLFSGIVTSIHQQGSGLDTLVYHNAQGTALAKLLSHDEVVHLQDVAILIERMKVLLLISSALFIGLLSWIYFTAVRMPTFKSMLFTVLAFLALLIIAVLIIGPYEVFYTLHVWVFPDEHKWFFYYEESLMSTMMKAPDLFAFIAILLLVIAVPSFVLIMWIIRRVVLLKPTRSQAT
jgi:hypothetical protein